MQKKERFIATMERKPVDRPAWWLGEPTQPAMPGLLAHFGVADEAALKAVLDDDVYNINVPYSSPAGNHIATAFDFSRHRNESYLDRTLTDAGFFDGAEDPDIVDAFPWPDPELYLDREESRRRVESSPSDRALLGLMWSCHFQDACAAFGMESALMAMLTEPDVFQAVIDRIVAFYLRANELFYEATKGKLTAVLMGNDFGCQTSLLVSPELLRNHVFAGTRMLVEQAHSYGLKVIHHSCGAVFDIIEDIIETGADALHPIQAMAAKMDAPRLKREFGDRLAFCGGIDAQYLLVNQGPDAVGAKVRELRELFPTGLIISPSHEAILPDIPPENIRALATAATAVHT